MPHWPSHIKSPAVFGVQTHGFFSDLSNPRNVVALISFDEHADPEAVTRDYMQSDAFKRDMAGFDRLVSIVPKHTFIP